MPNRILREGINSSPRVDQLSESAEILYRRLISVVDDYGRYYASPGTLRGACWPLRPEKIDEQLLSNCLAEIEEAGLLVRYQEGRFLQLSDFNQQVRSKSKFPEPDINCLAIAEQLRSTRRSRNAKSESESESDRAPDPAPVSERGVVPPPRWKRDEQYARFATDYLSTGGAFIDADFHEAFEFCWRHLSIEQRLQRVAGLNRHIEEYTSDPRFAPKPRKFLEVEWQRPPRPPKMPPVTTTIDRRREEVGNGLRMMDQLRKGTR